MRATSLLRVSAVFLFAAANACAPATAVRTATPSPPPTVEATGTPVPEETPTVVEQGTVEGLVLVEDGELIVGVNWLSRSRITYRVVGGDVSALKDLLGESVRVSGDVIEKGPFLKEIVVKAVEISPSAERLSMREGYIKELGVSIYMQGTHVLVDRDGNLICLLVAAPGGPDLDNYAIGKVRVIGRMEKTVEGDARILYVQSIGAAK